MENIKHLSDKINHDTSHHSMLIPHLQLLKNTAFNIANSQDVQKGEGFVEDQQTEDPNKFCHSPPSSWINTICKLLWDRADLNDLSNDAVFRSGLEMVTNLMKVSNENNRLLAAGVWAVLLRERAIKVQAADGNNSNEDQYLAEFLDRGDVYYQCCCSINIDTSQKEVCKLSKIPMESSSLRSASNLLLTKHESIDEPGKHLIHIESFEMEDAPSESDKFETLLDRLFGLAADHVFRRILAKPTVERTDEELTYVFKELLLIPSLAQFSASVRYELSKCILYDVHKNAGTVIFTQGDPGTSWYIIHRGSVWVDVEGQGHVCRLSEGDDFGKLALVTGSPRAASIISAEDNCQFLKVDKTDFDRILRDLERNIVRLREQDSDVLILERLRNESSEKTGIIAVSSEVQKTSAKPITDAQNSLMHYAIMAGTVEKIVEHLLDVRMESLEGNLQRFMNGTYTIANLCPSSLERIDQALEDFFLTFHIYTTSETIFVILKKYSKSVTCTKNETCPGENGLSVHPSVDSISKKIRRVLIFLLLWCESLGLSLFSKLEGLELLLEELRCMLTSDVAECPLIKLFENLHENCKILWTSRLQGTIQSRSYNGNQDTTVSENRISQSTLDKQIFKSTQSKWSPSGWVKSGLYRASDVSQTCNYKQSLLEPSQSKLSSFVYVECPVQLLTRYPVTPSRLPLEPKHHSITFPVYCESDKKERLLTVPIGANVHMIKQKIKQEFSISTKMEELKLVEVFAKGDKIILDDNQVGIMFDKSPNSCIFITSNDRIPTLTPLPIQLAVTMNFLDQFENERSKSISDVHLRDVKVNSPLVSRSTTCNMNCKPLEDFTVDEIASILTYIHVKLAVCVNPVELLAYTLGSATYCDPSAHIRLLVNHFTLIHAWTVTQLVTTSSLTKRIHRLKRFIKLADLLISPPLHDQYCCFAIVLGLASSPVARLVHTWERVPTRWRRVFSNKLLPLVDPARNHRAARMWLATTATPHLPFLALILKDLRFAEDANTTRYQQGSGRGKLINFEKMRLVARSLRLWNSSISGYGFMHPEASLIVNPLLSSSVQVNSSLVQKFNEISHNSIKLFLENLECIDDNRILTQFSLRLEPKKL